MFLYLVSCLEVAVDLRTSHGINEVRKWLTVLIRLILPAETISHATHIPT